MQGGAWEAKSAAISSARGITSDMEALRSYFDTNGDGKLTSADAGFAQFKVLVTNADGGAAVKTLAQLGITEINLTEDSTRIELPDGSVIEGWVGFKGCGDNRRLRGADRRATNMRRRRICCGEIRYYIGEKCL